MGTRSNSEHQPAKDPLTPGGRFHNQRQELIDLFQRLDQDIAAFQSQTGMHCLPDCGHCCESPHVEVSVLEMFPLAYELIRQQEGDIWFERIKSVDFRGVCVFYRPDPLVAGHGRCTQYPLRPLICRLFGFSTIHNKNGRPDLVTCGRIKKEYPADCHKAGQWIGQGGAVPGMNDYVRALLTIDPHWGLKQYPINKALALALEYAVLLFRYDAGEHGDSTTTPKGEA